MSSRTLTEVGLRETDREERERERERWFVLLSFDGCEIFVSASELPQTECDDSDSNASGHSCNRAHLANLFKC